MTIELALAAIFGGIILSIITYEATTGRAYFDFVRRWVVSIARHIIIALTLCAVALPSLAQQTTLEQRLVTDYNGLAGSLQAASAAFDHMKDGTRAILEQAAKDVAELRYWREYVAGLPKSPPESK